MGVCCWGSLQEKRAEAMVLVSLMTVETKAGSESREVSPGLPIGSVGFLMVVV